LGLERFCAVRPLLSRPRLSRVRFIREAALGGGLDLSRSAAEEAPVSYLSGWSGPIGNVLIGAFLRAQFIPQLAPVDWSDLVAVGLGVQPERPAARAAVEPYALKEPFAELLFGHANKLRGAEDRFN